MITLASLFLWLIFGSKNTANIRVQKRGPTWVFAKSFSSSGAFLESGFGVGFGAGFVAEAYEFMYVGLISVFLKRNAPLVPCGSLVSC